MKTSPNFVALGALSLAIATGAALAQERPESLLPPGFDEPATPAPAPTRAPTPATPRPPSAAPAPLPAVAGTPTPAPSASATPPSLSAAELARYELPESAKRSTARVGGLDGDSLPPDAFGRSDGRYLETLMRRLRAPIASRWLSIALRRALLSPVDTPANVNGASFAAERAWLLLRMGEANAARGVVQGVDLTNYTPKMFQVAQQVALATADPAGLCPLWEPASKVSGDQAWLFARIMCEGLRGDAKAAAPLVQTLHRRGMRDDVDLALAEKVLGAGADSSRAVTVQWSGVNRLTTWRYGLATATGADIPEELLTGASPQLRYWRATAPMISAQLRAPFAELAAAQGVFSSAGLVDLYGEVAESESDSSAELAVARDLRTAYTAPSFNERMSALRTLWDVDTPQRRFGRLVLTARAAARIVPNAEIGEDAPRLIASMLTAGRDIAAMRWAGAVQSGTDGWAMLALANPSGTAAVSYGDADSYRSNASAHKARMLAAGLAGLGRLNGDDARRLTEANDLRIAETNSWTKAIDDAAARNEPATVLLLAAIAMQTPAWEGVSPEAVFHITSALRRVGMENYARMIAAEAIARL